MVPGGPSLKLLDEVRQALRRKRCAYSIEQCYVRSAEQFIRFPKGPDGFRHPNTLGAPPRSSTTMIYAPALTNGVAGLRASSSVTPRTSKSTSLFGPTSQGPTGPGGALALSVGPVGRAIGDFAGLA
jgi:hypothetical protein